MSFSYVVQLVARCLELTLWSREERGDVFLGEVLLDLRDLPRYSNATWCSLHDHDDNSPPLPRPRCLTAINSPASSRSSSFYDASDVARSLEAQDPSRDSSQGGTNSGRSGFVFEGGYKSSEIHVFNIFIYER